MHYKKIKRILLFLLAVTLQLAPLAGAAQKEEPAAGYIALTFDDGPSGQITRRLLQGLKERDVCATFFLCGYRLEQYPETAASIAADGHELGLHGYSHRSMKTMDADTLQRELDATRTLIQTQAGVSPTLLRPPGGCCGGNLAAVSAQNGLPIITWSVDPQDWADHSCAHISRCILENVKDGDIVLLHDMWDASVDAALEVVDALTQQGFAFVTVSQLARIRGVALEAGQVYRSFP